MNAREYKYFTFEILCCGVGAEKDRLSEFFLSIVITGLFIRDKCIYQ